MWRNIEGLSRTIDFTPDDSLIWDENDEMVSLHLVSSSGLLKEAVKLGAKVLEEFLPEDLISVVTKASIKHYNPCVVGKTIVIGVRVTNVEGNLIQFYSVITKENRKIAEIEFTRAIVSKSYLRRKVIEETA
ncbi:thioesterase family protein [Thermosipho atlanticus]|uniref:Predicted thioesterase n=1 Tax=Thermosipho atlanticus DSM 15807 TaxID=1123380 RepID=A0A1M5RXJ9_9BACT|nr:thioesterase [Thermosipho atlanticus]SHH30965.1 Predicted thioesterase [Thermosipho atlanticus DSM 15807]